MSGIVWVLGFVTHVTHVAVFPIAPVTEPIENCIEPLFSAFFE